jgi:hypothetical protein
MTIFNDVQKHLICYGVKHTINVVFLCGISVLWYSLTQGYVKKTNVRVKKDIKISRNMIQQYDVTIPDIYNIFSY